MTMKKPLVILTASRGKEIVGPNIEVTWRLGPPRPVAGDRPSNIVFVLADDLGTNDISTYGGGGAGGLVPTPNVDKTLEQKATKTDEYIYWPG